MELDSEKLSDEIGIKLSELLHKSRELKSKIVDASANANSQNFFDISDISRQYFELMIKLNESPLIRSYFATEKFDETNKTWNITPNEYTRDFFTDGLAIYHAYITIENENGSKTKANFEEIIITGYGLKLTDLSQEEANKLCEADKIIRENTRDRILHLEELHSDGYVIDTLERWTGCGMKIPRNIKFELAPNLTWPTVEIQTEIDGELVDILISNSANQIEWQEVNGSEVYRLYSDNKFQQGLSKGVLAINGKVKPESLKLTMPYTCASFDILTGVKINSEELILFTT